MGASGSKISNFFTQVDDWKIQQYPIDCINSSGQSQDYLKMNRFLKGSILYSLNQYQYNWC